MNKAAIIIGVNQTGGLPPLKAAVAGAKQVGQWLEREGFTVYPFGDGDSRPVTTRAIYEQIEALIEPGTLEQLVLFFSGHGFLNNNTEYWLLPEAPANPNEAINVAESVELARWCGIPNVVLISDACRSLPQSLTAERVRGSLIFPNQPVSSAASPEIDRFFATLPGQVALELVVEESVKRYAGIFTDCFLQAYRRPDAAMIRRVGQGPAALEVVPNRQLKEYLRREVPARLTRQNLTVGQLPYAIVESGEEVYLAPVRPESLGFSATEAVTRGIIDVQDVAEVAIAEAIAAPLLLPAPMQELINTGGLAQTDFQAAVDRVSQAQAQGRGHYETRTGLTIVGAEVAEAKALHMAAQVLFPGDFATPAFVRLTPEPTRPGGSPQVSSVILRFAGGSGTVLAALENYIATVLVDQGRVVNVSYVPSDNSPLWADYVAEQDRLEKLRALVAAAADHGVFRVDRQNAGHLANHIRILKGIDPTLGLYAAYAYAEVGLLDQVRSLLMYMGLDLAAGLFDIAMLANERAEANVEAASRVVPFCPMLAQGWSLLRVKNTKIPVAAERAREHLLPALWTTFDPTGMNYIMQVFDEGGIL